METKFIHSGNGCVLTELISENSACFLPSFSLISGILEKIQSNHVKTLVLVPRVATFIKTIIISDFLESKYLKKLNRPDSFINRGQEEASQRSASPEKNIRAGYHLYLNLHKESSLSIYKSLWKKWSSCSIKQNVDPFFVYCFQDGYEYHIIGCIRFVISAFYNHQTLADHHPLVGSLMSPVFNIRLPKPQYSFAWDVK